MKTFRILLCALLLLPPAASAQKPPTPPGAEPDASPGELLDRLESDGLFAAARVALTEGVWRYRNGTGPNDEPALETDRQVFSQGFRFAGLKGCMLTLRNDDARMLPPPGEERAGAGGRRDAAALSSRPPSRRRPARSARRRRASRA